MTTDAISITCLDDRLTVQDDPGAWREFLAIIGEEFVERYRTGEGKSLGFPGLELVPIGGGRTKLDGQPAGDLHGQLDTQRTVGPDCPSWIGQ